MPNLAVDTENQIALSREGFAISSWVGFNEHMIPLYTHRDISDKKVGDIFMRARVGDPRTLNNGEAVYLAKKATLGFFPWKPGEDCLKREFKVIEVKRRPLGGAETIKHEPQMGCKWCRGAASTSMPPEPVAVEVPPLATPPPAPVLPEFDVLHCVKCPNVFVGENAMNERRGHMMRDHQTKPSTTRRKARRVPDEGSAKES